MSQPQKGSYAATYLYTESAQVSKGLPFWRGKEWQAALWAAELSSPFSLEITHVLHVEMLGFGEDLAAIRAAKSIQVLSQQHVGKSFPGTGAGCAVRVQAGGVCDGPPSLIHQCQVIHKQSASTTCQDTVLFSTNVFFPAYTEKTWWMAITSLSATPSTNI